LELARAMATHPKLLLLDEIAGGLTDAECQSLIETIKAIHAEGVTIIWIEHVLHALNSVVERLLVLDFGKVIGIGEPAAIMESAGSQGNLPGDRDMTALLENHDLTARYGDFQALFGVDIALGEGETVAIIGANGAGKTTLMRSISGILKNEPGSIITTGKRHWRPACG
jgi:ABC-type branched-subunit amino acid transport system ATPase component